LRNRIAPFVTLPNLPSRSLPGIYLTESPPKGYDGRSHSANGARTFPTKTCWAPIRRSSKPFILGQERTA
jgi:hypothetical protein